MRQTTLLALTTVSFSAMLVAASPAYAQAAQAVQPGQSACQAPAGQVDKAACPDTSGPQAPGTEANTLNTTAVAPPAGEGEIVVTGSRIRRTTFNSPDSVTVITRDRATQAGFDSTASILQSTAVTGGTAQQRDTYGGLVTDGGPGVNTLSLRGLGNTRTLILLNGRRVAPAGSRGSVGSADLNVLPNAMVDEIQVLNSGASSVYGSDAIAGVVNIITRKKMNGISLEASQNFPQLGAGSSGRYSVSAGKTGSNWSISGSVEYYKRDPLLIRDVPSLTCPTQRYLNGEGTLPGSGDFIDPLTGQPKCFPLEEGGVTLNTLGTGAFHGQAFRAPGTLDPLDPGQPLILTSSLVALATGVPANYTGSCTRFRPNAAVTTGLLPGYECVGGGPLSTNIRDTSSGETLAQTVVSHASILTGYLNGQVDTNILGNAQFYGEFLANRRKSGSASQLQLNIDYPVGSPLIPAVLQDNPLSGTIGARVFGDRGAVQDRAQVDFVKASLGVRGALPFKDWRYDLYSSKSWSDATYTTNNVLLDRLAQSLDVVADPTAPGGFRCRLDVGGCVAAPTLTGAIVSGGFAGTPWYNYVSQDVTGNTKFRETTFTADLNGSLFALPGGDLKAALGAEYRKSSIDDTPSLDSINGNLQNYSSSTPTRGKDSVYELYAELQAPLLKDLPFAKLLVIDGSARYTHYKSYGGQKTYKVGGLYKPVDFLSFRGSYGTSYRAPALFEQFLGASSGFLSSSTDPCADLASVTDPLVKSQCLADGLPADFVQNGGVTVLGVGGADAGLKAETSKNLTYGVVLQHNFGDAIGAFSFAADYFRIEVDNGVAQLSASSILDQCYANPQRTLCGLIHRDPYTGPGSGALTVTQSYVNIATSFAKGIDFVANYTRRLGPGQLTLDGQATKMLKRYDQTLPTDEIVDVVGLTANPKWAGTFDAGYKIGRINFRYGFDYIGKTDDAQYLAQFGFTPDTYDYKVKAYVTHRASIRYETKQFQLTLGVRNMFDKKPPKITTDNPLVNTFANVPLQGGYDFYGRTFFVNGRVSF